MKMKKLFVLITLVFAFTTGKLYLPYAEALFKLSVSSDLKISVLDS